METAGNAVDHPGIRAFPSAVDAQKRFVACEPDYYLDLNIVGENDRPVRQGMRTDSGKLPSHPPTVSGLDHPLPANMPLNRLASR